MSDKGLGIFDGAAEQEEDDVPSADPQIQVDYEAALGRFLVAFNKVEYELALLIKMILSHSNQPDRWIEVSAFKSRYSQKVKNLELLSPPGCRHKFDSKLADLLRTSEDSGTRSHTDISIRTRLMGPSSCVTTNPSLTH